MMNEITKEKLELYFSILSENENFNKNEIDSVYTFMIILHEGERNVERLLSEYEKFINVNFPSNELFLDDQQVELLISSEFRKYYLDKYESDINSQKREMIINKLE